MANRTSQRPKRRSSGRSKKKPSHFGFKSLAKILLAAIFLGFAGLSVFFLLQNKTWSKQGLSRDMLESIFLAANVQPDKDVSVREKEDGERWLVMLDSLDKRKVILDALGNALAGQGQKYKSLDKSRRGGQHYQLVEVPLNDGTDLRIIFQVSEAKPSAKTVVKRPEPVVLDRSTPTTPVTDERPQIAIILDDIGHKKIEHLQPVLDLRYPITFAVLPYLKYSKANALYLHQNQYEVILHMPMEPGDYPKNNPGKGAILSHQNDGEIRSSIDKALRSVPFVKGVNNHMGSKITANRTLMRSVLDELKKRDLFFVDSRTASSSVAFDLAQQMGLTTARRDVFLDSVEDYDFTVKQLREAREVAKSQGLSVVIGHPYPSTLQALLDEMPKMESEGFQFVFASNIVRDYAEAL